MNPGLLSTDREAIVHFWKAINLLFLPQVFCFGAVTVNSKWQSSTVRWAALGKGEVDLESSSQI